MGVKTRLAAAMAAVLVGGSSLCLAAPAQAAGSVSVANAEGKAVADPQYATRLTVSGRGFQSIKGGRGGIYVAFGTVKGAWQPSRGGVTGRDYFYVPDSESGKNNGFQKYVAFPGSDTAAEANGGTLSTSGAWSTSLTVPGSSFQAADRNGKATTIDCLKVQCGVITVGAHGLKNAHNETFTPIRFEQGSGSAAPSTPASGQPSPTAAPAVPPAATAPVGKPRVSIDEKSARAGAALSFTAAGLVPGRQVTVVFDDGAAASGPFLVGTDGTFAGVIALPASTGSGTHELRVFGAKPAPRLKFAVSAAADPVQTQTAATQTAATQPMSAAESGEGKAAIALTGLAAGLVVVALGRLVFSLRGRKSRG